MEREPPSVRMLAHEHEKLLTPSRLSSSSTVKEEQPKNATGTAARIPPSTRLYRSAWALVLVTIYAGLALFCWVTTCLLATGNPKFDRSGDSSYWDRVTFRSRFAKAQRSYHAARVIQSFVAVLTIPITSAICSSAAVIFAQQKHKASSMSIRQVMALADGSWSDLAKWAQISFAWKRYGSTFLLGAVLLNILGGLVPPLQQALLSSKVIQIPLEARHYQIFDMPDLHQPAYRNGKDDNLISILTRNALNTATDSPYEPQAQLWEGIDANCSRRSYYDTAEDYSPSCEQSGNTFSNITGLRDPFFSELPNSANTGIFRHFAPRINSSAKYEFVSSFPSGCDKLLGAFYVEYANNNAGFEMLSWSIRVCMPANLLTSPWKATRDRQDFSEELYINITFKDNGTFPRDSALGDVAFKVTLNTTAGYFELPNHMNSGLPGPLLLKDPVKNCGPDCPNQRDRWSNVR
jgi:hypothetical protein